MPFRRDGSVGLGWEALLEGQVGSGGRSKGPEEFGRVSRCQEALPNGWEGLGSPLVGLGRVQRPFRRAGKHLEAHQEGWE